MFERGGYIFVIIGLLLCVCFCDMESVQGQTQVEESSAQDTVSQTGDTEEPPVVTREKIQYHSGGKKDPFKPLYEAEEEQEELPPLHTEGATVAGIMLGPEGRLALIRDTEGRTYVLGEGAKVKNGYLRKVKTDGVIFNIIKYGRYRKVELELKSAKKAKEFDEGVARTAHETTPVRPKPKATQPAVRPVEVHIPPEQMKGSKFTLQVAAFRKENDAKRLQQWLRERKYETRIESVTIPESGLWYRVRLGTYDTYPAVKKMAETFRERFDFYCWIVPIDS